MAAASGQHARRVAIAAVAQMTSIASHAHNFSVVATLAREAKARGAAMLFLPEIFAFFGDEKISGLDVAEALDGPVLQRYCNLARETGLWLSGAGFQEATDVPVQVADNASASASAAAPVAPAVPSAPVQGTSPSSAGDATRAAGVAAHSSAGATAVACSSSATSAAAPPPEAGPAARKHKIYNTHVVIGDDGAIKAVYRKASTLPSQVHAYPTCGMCSHSTHRHTENLLSEMHVTNVTHSILPTAASVQTHLFDVNVPGAVLNESAYVVPGSELVIVDTPLGRLGLTTCYDVRFPELYQRLVAGAFSTGIVPRVRRLV